MEPDSTSGKNLEMVLGGPARVRVVPNGTSGISAGLAMLTAPIENSLTQPTYLLSHGPVMTDEQLEILRRQITVYATICSQLVEMHKASMAQQTLLPSMMSGQHLPYDPAFNSRSTGRQRWTPSQIQLQILEKLFEKGNATPNKQKIKEITVNLSQHGQISETNVYNWFQNRKARAKRKHQVVTQKDAESEVDTDEVESPKDKKPTLDRSFSRDGQSLGKLAASGFASDETFGMMDQKPHMSNYHFENRDLGHQIDTKVDTRSYPLLNRGANYQPGSTQASHSNFGTMVVIIDGKQWEVPSGVLDVKGSFGVATVLLDFQGQIVPTDESGFTLEPLHMGESYTLARLGDGIRGIGSHTSEGMVHLNETVDLLNEGL